MQPLEYKNIGREEHLTFDSIRRLAFHQLSTLKEREARHHIQACNRCQSIHESLALPGRVRRNRVKRSTGLQWLSSGLLVIMLLGLTASYLYLGGLKNLSFKNLAGSLHSMWSFDESNLYLPVPIKMEKERITDLIPDSPEIESKDKVKSRPTVPIAKVIDTVPELPAKPDIEIASGVKKQSNSNIEPEQEDPGRVTGIYGKITANGQALQGVTVMVPGGNTAKISDSDGKYYIQVPRGTGSLVYIYRGKQLVKELDPESRKRDINLKIDSMEYPEIEAAETGYENIASF